MALPLFGTAQSADTELGVARSGLAGELRANKLSTVHWAAFEALYPGDGCLHVNIGQSIRNFGQYGSVRPTPDVSITTRWCWCQGNNPVEGCTARWWGQGGYQSWFWQRG